MAEIERMGGGRGMNLGNKSELNFYMAPLWPIPRAAPLQEQPDAQWTKDVRNTDEIGRASLQYSDSTPVYTSEDGECLRLELHQAQTAALSTILTIIFLLSSPLIGVVAGAQPGLAGASAFGQLSIGNTFNPVTACKYTVGEDGQAEEVQTNVLLQNKLGQLADVTCSAMPLSSHIILLVNVVCCMCFMILVKSRHADLELLRKAVPHLCEYCVHISGLGVSSKKQQEIRTMIMQLDWIKDNSEEVELHHVWQDDLHWGWAKRQIAQLEADGKVDSRRCDVLQDLVKALDSSRTNIGFPRPYAGHSLCIMHKQHMSRACLHEQKKSLVDRLILLLPIQPGGKEKKIETASVQKGARIRPSMVRAGEPSDIDYLSLLSGGSVSISDTWRGR
eukprot:SAG22_NODE_128_length_18787_cov_19.577108_7_plen_390_part_00